MSSAADAPDGTSNARWRAAVDGGSPERAPARASERTSTSEIDRERWMTPRWMASVRSAARRTLDRVYGDERSLLCFPKSSPTRAWCTRLVEDSRFQIFVFVVVGFNTAVLAMELPERAYQARGGSLPLTAVGSRAVQAVFVLVFGFEALAKIVAYGFAIGPTGYLRQRSNVFDFAVVVVGIVDSISQGSNAVGTLRLLRALQPLRALNKFKSGRMVLETMRKSIPLLFDVVVFMSWFVIMCTVVGTLSFGGKLTAREYAGSGFSASATPEEICANLTAGYSNSPAATDENPHYPSDENICLYSKKNTLLRTETGRGEVYCCESGTSPVDGFVNFDDFGRGTFVVLQAMTVDGWNDIAWPCARAMGLAAAFSFYCIVVLLGGFFVLQLFTSVICATLSDIEDEAAAKTSEGVDKVEVADADRGRAEDVAVADESMSDWTQSGYVSVVAPHEDDLDDAEGIEWLRLRGKLLISHPRFETVINSTIFLNTVAMMSQTAEGSAGLEKFRSVSEYVFFTIFCGEMLLKHFALGLRAYWSSPWSRLDGCVVLAGVVDLIMSDVKAGGVNLSFLRMLRVTRLFRVARVFRRSSSFNKVIQSIILGSQRIWVFLIVWAVFMAIFAILGTQLFSAKGDIDDERLNFRDFWSSVLTLFVVSTGENTFEVAWSIMKAEGKAAGIYMIVWCLITTSILALVLGILIDSITADALPASVNCATCTKARQEVRALQERLASSYGFDIKDIPDWLLAKVEREYSSRLEEETKTSVDASESVKGPQFEDEMDAEKAEPGRNADDIVKLKLVHEVAVVRHWLISLGYDKHTEHSIAVAKGMRRQTVVKARDRLSKRHAFNAAKRDKFMRRIAARLEERREGTIDRLIPISLRCIMSKSTDLYAGIELSEVISDKIPYHALFPPVEDAGDQTLATHVRRDNFQIAMSFYGIDPSVEADQKRLRMLRITKEPWFDRIVLLLICATSILLATETRTFPAAGSHIEKIYLVLDILFNAIFTAELILKLYALGAWKSYGAYFRSAFNCMDAFVVATSWLIVFLGTALPIRSLRVARILRPLRTVNRVQGLRIVVETIMSSIPAVGSVCLIGVAMLTLLSVLGMELFLGKMHRCTLTSAVVTTKSECIAAGGVWRKAEFNFDSFPEAFLSVFIVATGDNWQDLMFESMDIVGVDMQPKTDSAKWAAIYFFVCILFAFLLWANLFISALVENFNRIARSGTSAQGALMTDAQRVWQQAMTLAVVHADNSWRRHPPNTKWKAAVHNIVSRTSFDTFCVVMILLNMVVVMMVRVGATHEEEMFITWMGNALAAWYVLEAAALIIAMKWSAYWRSGWNKIDFVVAVSGAAGLLVPAVYQSGVGSFFRMIRFLRLFKVVQVSKGLRTLFATFLGALPGVANVALLSLLCMYIYACLGVSFFGNMRSDYIGAAVTEFSDFRDFPKAMISLFVCFTGNWQGYFSDVYVDTLCYGEEPLPDGVSCGHRYLAIFYFLSYVIIAVFFLGNLFVAIILERFSFCASAQGVYGADESGLLYTTLILRRVTRAIAQRVKSAKKLTPFERQELMRTKSSQHEGSAANSGASTPVAQQRAPLKLSKVANKILHARKMQPVEQIANDPADLHAFEDDLFDRIRSKIASDTASVPLIPLAPLAPSKSPSPPDDIDVGFDESGFEFEELKQTLLKALPGHRRRDILAAANAVDRLARTSTRSLRVSRSASRQRSRATSPNHSDDGNRSDEEEDVRVVALFSRQDSAYERNNAVQTPQQSRGRSTVPAHSQRERITTASARMARAASAGSSRYASSSDEENADEPTWSTLGGNSTSSIAFESEDSDSVSGSYRSQL